MHHHVWNVAGVVALVMSVASPAAAQDPKFEYGKAEEVKDVKDVEWKASAQAGFVMTRGNSKTTTFNGGATASRKQGNNKLLIAGETAYARTGVFAATDADMSGDISAGEIDRVSTTTSKSWLVTARYDRFFSKSDSAFATGKASADEPAGKEFVGGGQLGYSRAVFTREKHKLIAEAGYDFSYEDPVVGDGVAIHSARGFVGYEGTLRKDTGLTASVEGLFNVNTLDTAGGEIGAFEDTRVNATTALTTKLFEDISFRFAFTVKFDNAPSARAPFALPYEPGFVPLADEVDTKTEASLIINFL